MGGGMGGGQPEIVYREQLSQLNAMGTSQCHLPVAAIIRTNMVVCVLSGFTDATQNIAALVRAF